MGNKEAKTEEPSEGIMGEAKKRMMETAFNMLKGQGKNTVEGLINFFKEKSLLDDNTEKIVRQVLATAENPNNIDLTKFVEVFGAVAKEKGLDLEKITQGVAGSVYDRIMGAAGGSTSAGNAPAGGATTVVADSSSAGVTPSADHGADTTDPGADTTKPGAGTTDPGADTTKPGAGTTDPGADKTDPGTDTTDPGADTTDADVDTIDPGADTTEQSQITRLCDIEDEPLEELDDEDHDHEESDHEMDHEESDHEKEDSSQ